MICFFNREFKIAFEFSLNIKKNLIKMEVTMSTEILLVIMLPISFLIIFGGYSWCWLARDYMMNYREIPRPHPEMFDPDGNLIPDEIVAFRFENYDDNNEEEDN